MATSLRWFPTITLSRWDEAGDKHATHKPTSMREEIDLGASEEPVPAARDAWGL